MELAVGTIISGKVTAITKFGAFVSLPGGKSGLVHISEGGRCLCQRRPRLPHRGAGGHREDPLRLPGEGKSICPSSRPNPSRNARSRPDRPGPRAVVPAPRSGGRSPPSGTGHSSHAAPGGAVLRGQAEAVHDPVRQQTVGAEPLYGGEAGQRTQEKIIENRQAEA